MVDNDEILKILDRILSVPGVIGAVFTDPDGNILAMTMPEAYDQDTANQVCNEIANLILNVTELGIKSSEFNYCFSNSNVAVRSSKIGCLFLLTMPNVNTAMFNIAVKMADKKIASLLDGGSEKKSSAFTSASQDWGQTVSYYRSFEPTADTATVRSLSLPRREIDRLTGEFSRYVGPAASVILRRIAEGMGQSVDYFDSSLTEELIIGLSENIRDIPMRKKFSQAAVVVLAEWVTASPPLAAETMEEPIADDGPQSSEQIIFNSLINQIVYQTKNVNPDSYNKIFEHIVASLPKLHINGSVSEKIGTWCEARGNGEIRAELGVEEMSKIIHTIYIFLCESISPVVSDRILGKSVQVTEKLPEAASFSPRKFL